MAMVMRSKETRAFLDIGDGKDVSPATRQVAAIEFGIQWISCAWTLKATRIEVLP
jgi:hypothetical protein